MNVTMARKMVLYALITKAAPHRTRHYCGLPPEVAGHEDSRVELPAAAFVVLDTSSEGVFLYRYDSEGRFAGDTWHKSVEEAKHQAAYEYSVSDGDWRVMPSGTRDPVEYVLKFVRDAM